METSANLRLSIQKGDRVISVILCFCYQDEAFNFPILPFCLCSGHHDSPNSIPGPADSPLCRQLAPREQARETPGVSNALSSALDRSPGLYSQSGEVRAKSDTELRLYWHALLTDLGLFIPPEIWFRETPCHAH